jgi:hypothetical protein
MKVKNMDNLTLTDVEGVDILKYTPSVIFFTSVLYDPLFPVSLVFMSSLS